MTTNYHTPIISSPKQAANAAVINAPCAELDAAIGALAAQLGANINATNGTFSGTVTAGAFVGDGSGLTGITGATGGVSNTGSTTIAADSDANGVGEIALQTGGVTRVTITAAGEIQLGGIVPARVHGVYVLGDSLTYATTYSGQLAADLGAGWAVRNRGVGGNTTAQMLERLTPEVLAAADGEYIVVLGGINDVVGDVAAATIESNLQAIYTAAQAAGLVVVAVTLTPFKTNTYWSSGRQTVLDTVNTWILNTAGHVDYAIDAYSVLEDAGDTLAAAYDGGDHLHLSTAGYQQLADTVYAGLSWTQAAATVALNVGGGTVGLNQSLLNTDDVAFADVTATGVLRAANWQAPTTGAVMEVQNAAGTEIVQVDTGTGGLTHFGAVYVIGAAGAGAVATYANNDTGYSGGNIGFVRSRTAFLTPSAVQGDDVLGTLAWGGYATGYQTAAEIIGSAYAVGAATVDGQLRINLYRSGAAIDALRLYPSAGAVFNEGGDAGFDFRVESDNDIAALYVDASADAVSIGGAGTTKIGVFGATPVSQPVLATGAGKTVDNVITVLQSLGWVRQA
jgi:lysophospholipase L1-like esterase